MAVAYIASRENTSSPVAGTSGDIYEIAWPDGAAVGHLLILHWATTKSPLDNATPRMRFHPSANMGGFTVTVDGDEVQWINFFSTVEAGGDPRRIGAELGVITADTPNPLRVQVVSSSFNPQHIGDAWGLTAFSGAEQAYMRLTAGFEDVGGPPVSFTHAGHSAPDACLWMMQFGVHANGGNDWDPRPSMGGGTSSGGQPILFGPAFYPTLRHPMVDLLDNDGQVTSVNDLSWQSETEISGDAHGWGAITIGLTDVEPAEPPPEPEPVVAGACHFRYHERWPDLVPGLVEVGVTLGLVPALRELARIMEDRDTQLEDHVRNHWTCDCTCEGDPEEN
jgi:hypothetical protein